MQDTSVNTELYAMSTGMRLFHAKQYRSQCLKRRLAHLAVLSLLCRMYRVARYRRSSFRPSKHCPGPARPKLGGQHERVLLACP